MDPRYTVKHRIRIMRESEFRETLEGSLLRVGSYIRPLVIDLKDARIIIDLGRRPVSAYSRTYTSEQLISSQSIFKPARPPTT